MTLSFSYLTELKSRIKEIKRELSKEQELQFQKAKALYQEGQSEKARNKLFELIQKEPNLKKMIKPRLTLSSWLLESGQVQEAYNICSNLPLNLVNEPELLLLFHIAYQSEHFDRVHELGSRAFFYHQDGSIAIINAIAATKLFEKVSDQKKSSKAAKKLLYTAIGWLQAADRLHFNNWSILNSCDFQALREDPLFIEFQKIHS